MDALEFAHQRRRMCSSFSECKECELYGDFCDVGNRHKSTEDDVKIIKIVEKWASEHAERTRQSEFLKIFPNTPIDSNGVIYINPCKIDENEEDNCKAETCADCRRDFWARAVFS